MCATKLLFVCDVNGVICLHFLRIRGVHVARELLEITWKRTIRELQFPRGNWGLGIFEQKLCGGAWE